MNRETTYKYFKALSRAAYNLKKKRFQTLLSIKKDLEAVDSALDSISDRYEEGKYAFLEDKVKKIKEKVSEKFRDL